jgi:hypothetical protein
LHTIDQAHEVADGIDLVDYHISKPKADDLVFDHNYQFEPIEPIRPQVVVQTRFICQSVNIDSEMPGDDPANLDGKIVIHRRILAELWMMIPRINNNS